MKAQASYAGQFFNRAISVQAYQLSLRSSYSEDVLVNLAETALPDRLQVQQVSFSYPNAASPAFDRSGLLFDLERGQTLGVIMTGLQIYLNQLLPLSIL